MGLKTNWIDKGVCYIKNLLNDNGTFMSFNSFKAKFGIKTDYIIYIGCVQAIKSYIRKREEEKTALTHTKINPVSD